MYASFKGSTNLAVTLVIAVCLVTPRISRAQLGGEDEREGKEESEILLEDVRFGIMAGAVSSSFPDGGSRYVDGGAEVTSRRLGYAVGGFLTFDFPGSFALQPEILYLQEGATLENSFSGDQREEYINFIELPILLKYQFLTDSAFSLNIFGGPAGGVSTSANPAGASLGATLGVEGGTAFGNSTASLGLRYEPDLTTISGGSSTPRPRSLLITAGVSF
jgi:hypothetical protein